MADKPACPVCGAQVDASETVCGRCGFKLMGRTERFFPVDSVNRGNMDRPMPTTSGTPALTIIKGSLEGESFQLVSFPMVIGRDPTCDLFLNDRTVTRKHASVDIIDGEVVITDLNSMNGTWIDGVACDRAVLKDGTIVQIGIFTMAFNI